MSANEHAKAQPMELAQPYDAVSRMFHWLVVALILAQVTIALILPSILPSSP